MASFGFVVLPDWETFEEGWPYDGRHLRSTSADYDGHPVQIKFGAFVGWSATEEIMNRISAIAETAIENVDEMELIDIIHQCAGHSCGQGYLIAKPISISNEFCEF